MGLWIENLQWIMTKSKLEIQNLIRFSIDQLSAKNGDKVFEDICRHFARQRICRNILPATGPVQSGGDQGRDFETFHSYLSQNSDNIAAFIGYSASPLVFACSLQKEPERAKIKSDVKTILGSGNSVERIYFFSGQDIPVGKRHKVQNKIKEDNSVNLEVIDAQALSEHLSDPDLFWIAVEFLHIPSDYCSIIEKDSEYAILKQNYLDRDIINGSFEEFSEIKSALRRIYKDEVLKVDLIFWFKKLDTFIKNDNFRDLKRKAIYEKFVAKLVGQKDIRGMDDDVKNYFSDFTEYDSPSQLEDATILLNFVKIAKDDLGHNIAHREIDTWIDQLRKITEVGLSVTQNDAKRCWLYQLKAMQSSFFDVHNDLESKYLNLIYDLNKIIPYLPNAQFYPLDKLNYFLLGIQEICLELNIKDSVVRRLEAILEKIDDEMGKRASSLVAGENIRNRAVKYFQAERYLLALEASHRLKIKWLSHDSPEGLIICSRLIARCYERMGMCYAAKYYGMISAHIVAESNEIDLQKYLPRALKELADSFYSAGDWIGFFDVATMALGMHSFISKDFDIYDESRENINFVLHPSIIKYLSKRFNLDAAYMIDYRISKWEYISDEIEEFYPQLRLKYNSNTVEELLHSLSTELHGKPFNELGKIRNIKFELLGIGWVVKFHNDYETTILAEQFISTIQILLIEFYKYDLLLLKTNVQIHFKYEKTILEPIFESVSNNHQIIWNISFPFIQKPVREAGKEYFWYNSIICGVLNEASLIPTEKFIKIVEEKIISDDWNTATLFASSYEKLYSYFIRKDLYSISKREEFTVEQEFYEPKTVLPCELQWKSTLVDYYDKNLLEQYIVNRNKFTKPFEITLPKLLQNVRFKAIVKNLRNKKWLDWQIVMAVGNVILNYKTQRLNPQNLPQIALKIVNELKNRPEKETFIPIPEDLITEERIEQNLKTLQPISVLESFELESKTKTPNCDAILEFLTFRLNYMEDGRNLSVLSDIV